MRGSFARAAASTISSSGLSLGGIALLLNGKLKRQKVVVIYRLAICDLTGLAGTFMLPYHIRQRAVRVYINNKMHCLRAFRRDATEKTNGAAPRRVAIMCNKPASMQLNAILQLSIVS